MPAPPRFETSEAVDAAMADADRAIRAASTTVGAQVAATAAAARTDTAAGTGDAGGRASVPDRRSPP